MVTLKKLFIFTFFCLGIVPLSNAQEIKIISTGQGTTEDEATKTALRSALEDAYGTFISSSTKIENDVLVSDEIVSLTQGNIKEYDVANSSQLANGLYSVTVESVVSLNELATYCQNKGMRISFNGKAFGMELKIREFNRQNEIKILKNLAQQIILMPSNLYDFELQTTEPKQKESAISIFVLITPHSTSNMISVSKLYESTVKSISLTKDERKLYDKLGVPYYKEYLYSNSYKPLYFRDKEAIKLLKKVFFRFRNVSLCYWTLLDNIKGKLLGIYFYDGFYRLDKTAAFLRKNPHPIGIEEKSIELVPKTKFTVKDKDLNVKIPIMRDIDELVKLEYTYTLDEITRLKTLTVEPNNDIYEALIKPKLLSIIAEFDNIK